MIANPPDAARPADGDHVYELEEAGDPVEIIKSRVAAVASLTFHHMDGLDILRACNFPLAAALLDSRAIEVQRISAGLPVRPEFFRYVGKLIALNAGKGG